MSEWPAYDMLFAMQYNTVQYHDVDEKQWTKQTNEQNRAGIMLIVWREKAIQCNAMQLVQWHNMVWHALRTTD